MNPLLLSRLPLAGLAVLWASAAHAGPPFVTDDPEPVENGHWEINSAVTGIHTQGGTNGFAPQIDANYGPAPGVQLHLQPQMAYSNAGGTGTGGRSYGVGDTEFGIKVRLYEQASASGQWMVSAYPFYEAPTGKSQRGLGAGSASEYLPLWVQWTGGKWTSFGGGGYWFESGAGQRNSWAAGWATLYEVLPGLQLGGEVFARTASTIGGHGTAGFNFGGTYVLGSESALLFSAGRGLANTPSTDQAAWYLGIRLTR